jgi:hypothetical protein
MATGRKNSIEAASMDHRWTRVFFIAAATQIGPRLPATRIHRHDVLKLHVFTGFFLQKKT